MFNLGRLAQFPLESYSYLLDVLSDRFSSVDLVPLCTYVRDVTIQYYPNPNPYHEKGTKFGPRILNPSTTMFDSRKRRLFAALLLGLGILDSALYLNQWKKNSAIECLLTPTLELIILTYHTPYNITLTLTLTKHKNLNVYCCPQI